MACSRALEWIPRSSLSVVTLKSPKKLVSGLSRLPNWVVAAKLTGEAFAVSKDVEPVREWLVYGKLAKGLRVC